MQLCDENEYFTNRDTKSNGSWPSSIPNIFDQNYMVKWRLVISNNLNKRIHRNFTEQTINKLLKTK